MNERFEDLLGQALDEVVSETWSKLTPGQVVRLSEKLVELTVRECGEVATKFAMEWCRHGEMPDYGYERVIKEHFGIE